MADPAVERCPLRCASTTAAAPPWPSRRPCFSVCGQQQALPGLDQPGLCTTPARDSLILNYPFIFRQKLDQANDGDTLEFAVDAIADGAAANPFAALRGAGQGLPTPATKTGPAWYSVGFAPQQVYWFWNWDGYRNGHARLLAGQLQQHQRGPAGGRLAVPADTDLLRHRVTSPARSTGNPGKYPLALLPPLPAGRHPEQRHATELRPGLQPTQELHDLAHETRQRPAGTQPLDRDSAGIRPSGNG